MVQYNSITFDRARHDFQFPGTFTIVEAMLRSPRGDESILSEIQQLDIVEYLHYPCMTGSVVMVDTRNLIYNRRIIGEEELYIVVTDEKQTSPARTYLFQVTSITDRKFLRPGAISYILHLRSIEDYHNSFVRVSKAYPNTPFEDCVQDIMRNWLISSRPITVHPTGIPQWFVIPNWPALYGVLWCASKAEAADYNNSRYLFFENKDGFYFLPWENLFDTSANIVYADVSVDPFRPTIEQKLTFDPRMPAHSLKFESFEIINSFDTIENSREGMYINDLRTVDVTNRSFEDTDYRYMRDFDNALHATSAYGHSRMATENARHATYPTAPTNKPGGDQFKWITRHQGLFDDEIVYGYNQHKQLPKYISQDQQINNIKVVGTLPGILEMKVGMQLNFDFPNPTAIGVLGGGASPDLYYSGNYVITKLRHSFMGVESYKIHLEMVKDSYSMRLDDTDDDSETVST